MRRRDEEAHDDDDDKDLLNSSYPPIWSFLVDTFLTASKSIPKGRVRRV
jgi:hypothetical protein